MVLEVLQKNGVWLRQARMGSLQVRGLATEGHKWSLHWGEIYSVPKTHCSQGGDNKIIIIFFNH